MSIWAALINSGKTQGLEQAFGAKDVTSSAMREAIGEWFSFYFDDETDKQKDPCMRLPALIVNKLCKTVFSEYEINTDGANKEFLDSLFFKLKAVNKKALQRAFVGGECFIKPVITQDRGIDFTTVGRDNFIPFARDIHGRITSVGTTETTIIDGTYYTLAERRTVDTRGTLTIESRLYRSNDAEILGIETTLDALEKYAELAPLIEIPGMYNLGMAPLKTPLLNCVDGSDDAVAVYAPAMGLIVNINNNEQQLNREFENGASKIIASADMINTDKYGRKTLSDNLFVAVDDDIDSVGVTVYSPALREASYLARKQDYLRDIESLIGLKRGLLSEVEAEERTATEITSSAGDYNLTIKDFQDAWEEMLTELISTCIVLGKFYGVKGTPSSFDPEKDISVDWGDGVLYNRDKTWSEYQAMAAAGLIKPEIAVAWYFELPWKTPRDIEKIRRDYMPEIEEMTKGE